MRRGPAIVAFLCIFRCFAPSPAAAAEPSALRFEIRKFHADNNTLLPAEAIDRALAPFAGKDRDFGTVQQALEALEQLYADAGYSTVQILLPEQELDRGEVHFRVVEGRIARIRFEGNRHFDDQNVARSVAPTLSIGATPRVGELADNLRLVNESPAKQTTVVMRAGDTEGDIEAVVRTADRDPRRTAITLDNTGTLATGQYRLGIAGQHANVLGRDHVLSAQVVTSPDDHMRQVFIFGLGYHVPLYSQNASFDAFYGYSNVDAGQINTSAGNYLIAGSGTVFGVRYNQNIPKDGEWERKLSYGLDYRAYEPRVKQVNSTTALVPDTTLHPLSLTYSAVRRSPDGEFSGYVSVVHNLPGGSDGNDEQFQAMGSRDGANSRYMLYRYGFNWLRLLPGDWQARLNVSGQHTAQMLVTGEQFGIGGADSVRGFLEREVSSDKGHRGSIELYAPEFGRSVNDELRLRALAFYDFGYVQRIRPAALEPYGAGIASAGFGLRGGFGKDVGFRLDYARVVDRAGDARGMRLHGAVSWVF